MDKANIDIYQLDVSNLQQKLEDSNLSSQERMETAKEMLAESSAALSWLTHANSDDD